MSENATTPLPEAEHNEAFIILPDDANRYGPSANILATTSLSCLAVHNYDHPLPKNRCSTVGNLAFEEMYDSKVKKPIIDTISRATTDWKAIHVLRSGYYSPGLEKNPIVIFVLLDRGALSHEDARSLASDIYAIMEG